MIFFAPSTVQTTPLFTRRNVTILSLKSGQEDRTDRSHQSHQFGQSGRIGSGRPDLPHQTLQKHMLGRQVFWTRWQTLYSDGILCWGIIEGFDSFIQDQQADFGDSICASDHPRTFAWCIGDPLGESGASTYQICQSLPFPRSQGQTILLFHQQGICRYTSFANLRNVPQNHQNHFKCTINKSQSHILSLPYWMAPETIQSSLTDQKTDIWAIGITAFELITSKIPYEDVPPQKVIFKIVQQPPRLSGDYPNEMIDFVHQCLQRDPRLRPTAAQLLTHPFIRNAKKTQLLFELLERAGMLSGEQQQASCETLNYTHNRVVTSLKLDASGTPIREDDESLKEETLKIKRTFRKIEKYKPGLGKIVLTLYLCRYTMKSSRSLKPRPPDEYNNLITHSHQLQQMKTNNEPSLFKYRVLEQKNKKIILEADEDHFNSFANALSVVQRFHDEIKQQLNPQPSSRKIRVNSDSEKSNNVSHPYPNPDIKEDQDFRRRIPHFFLSRFKKWAKMMEQDAAYKYLQNVQESKTSKQQRFELGDLQRCFQVQVNEPKESKLCKNLLKDLFISFLQNEATLQIIHYNKISSIEQKHKYIAEIKNMIQEMYELKPFDSYLSSEKIKGKKTIANNICQSPIQEKQEEQRDDFQIPQIQEKYSNESFKKYNQTPSLVKMNSFQ